MRIRPAVMAIVSSLALTAGWAAPAMAAEYIVNENVAPETAEDVPQPMAKAFKPETEEPSLFPRLKRKLKGLDPFVRDTRLNVHVRTYYLDRNPDKAPRSQGWAVGGWLEYHSGWWRDQIRVGGTAYTSQPLYAPDNAGSTLLLSNGGGGYTVLGQVYLQARLFKGTDIRLYRQTFNLPYVNRNDSRMTPNTHEAYTIYSESIPYFQVLASHITRMKTRNSATFDTMSEVAKLNHDTAGLTMVGGKLTTPNERYYIGAITQYAWDFMNTIYAEAGGDYYFDNGLNLRLTGQYTDQHSVGGEYGGDFHTYAVGGEISASYGGGNLSFAFTSVADSGDIRNPFGGVPSFISLMLENFDQAGEDSWLVGLSYNFKKAGLPGLSFIANYAQGFTPDTGPVASPNEQELDLTVDYRFQKGAVKGLWLRLRAAYLWRDDDVPSADDVLHFRLIVNHNLSLL